MEIKADVKNIESLKDFFFVVPDYQREYVWDYDNVKLFLQDIYDEFNPHTIKQTNYFIGSAIIVKRTDGQYDVIDGQQRLTTIIVALCAMRDVLQQLDLDKAAAEQLGDVKMELHRIIGDLLYKFSIQQSRKTPRLILQYEESKDYLVNLIGGQAFVGTATGSITRMQTAYKTIYEFVNGPFDNDQAELINFIRYFLINVEMVIIQPDNIGSALKIFETINERGIGLNAMDLLKNLLFSKANEDEFRQIKDIWKEILAHLEKCGEGDKPLRFLRYFMIAKYHQGIIREEEIYKWVSSSEGKRTIKYEQAPLDFAKELARSSKRYSGFIKAAQSWDADAEYPSVTGISYVSKNARQPFLLLLALNDSFSNEAINLLAKNIEVLMFYYAMNKVLTKYYETLFAELALKIRAIVSLEELKQFIQSDLANVIKAQRAVFNASFDKRTQADVQPLFRIKYIFGRVEEYIRSKVFMPANSLNYYQEQQLEHILPQEGENVPENLYPNGYDYDNSVFSMGNLTLLEGPINQSLNFSNDISSNEWFEVKTKAYKNSNILLTKTFSKTNIGKNTEFNKFVSTHLKHFDDWNMEKIQERQQMLKELCLETWNVNVQS
jgi:uncharacterized protein with ParB-like and HNH nuclease domain